jgi:hypothetical protein
MNEEALVYSYNLFKNDGYNGTLEDYKLLIESNSEALNYSYDLFKKDGYADSIEEFQSIVGLKKKDDTDSASEDGSLDFKDLSTKTFFDQIDMYTGNLPVSSVIPKFLKESIAQGVASGIGTDEALKVMSEGKNISDEDLQKLIEVNKIVEEFGPTEGMLEFDKDYQESISSGDSAIWAFVKGLAKNPKAAAEVAASSMARMITGAMSSPEGLGVVAAGSGVGAGVGAALGTLSGPFAPATSTIGAITGSIKGAMAAAGGLTETTASFVEFMQEELNGQAFTQENIRKVLDDEEAYERMINRSLARGGTIALVDFVAAGASGKAVKGITKVGRTGKALKGLAATSIEAVGGGVGETAARLIVGQELNVPDIGFEMFGEIPMAAISGPLGLIGQPKYKVNGGSITKKDFLRIVDTATDEELMSMKISVDNDDAASEIINSKIQRAKVKQDIDPLITDQKDIDTVVDRELQIKDLKKKDSSSAKNRVRQLESEIKEIQDKYTATAEEAAAAPAVAPTVTQQAPQTVAEALNRPVTLTSLGGSVLEAPIEGDLYVEGQQVVVEDEAGNITELGNVDEISSSTLESIGIQVAEPAVKPMTDGNLMFEDRVLISDKKGIKRNKRGEISRVTLREEGGAFVTLRGANAEQAAYQILLREATSPEQAEFINQQLEQDEEFQNEFREATEPTAPEAAQVPQQVAGNRLRNEPLPDATRISDKFAERTGRDRPRTENLKRLDEERSKKISDAFDALTETPADPRTIKSYEALANETLEQYQSIIDDGYTVVINNTEPYDNSQDMINDLRDNKRMKIFSTEAGFGDTAITDEQRASNPMLRDSGFTDANGQPLLVNDVFRFVHDFFGHAKVGNSFGPRGEEIAWQVHSQMYSPTARRAMTTETRGQNSWVNFSGVNDKAFVIRDEARALRDEADRATDVNEKIRLLEEAKKKTKLAYDTMKFADQKIGLLPDEFVFEEVAQDPIQVEVDKLSDILGTKNVQERVDNAVKALSKIAPDVQFLVYETEQEYTRATGNTASGSYDPITRVVSINKQKANGRTVAHEAFHAILTNYVKTDAEAKALTEKMIKAVSRNAPFELKEYLNEFAADYDNNIQSEEKLAELVGKLADEYTSLPTSTQSTIKRWLDSIAKALGLVQFTDAEVIDVLNTISGKLAVGEEIAFEDIDVLGNPNTVGAKMAKRFQANFKDPISGLSFIYDKNSERFKSLEEQGFITRDRSLADFDGDILILHQPDGAFSGTIMKDGVVIVEGKGGIFYPIKFHDEGFFWASTERAANKMAKDLNEIYERNNGRVLMALTSSPYDKVLYNVTMSNAVVDFFMSKAVDRRFKIKKDEVRKALIDASNKTLEIKDKTTGLGLNIKKTENIDNALVQLREKLSSATFADRKVFVNSLISNMVDFINNNEVSVKQFGEIFSTGIQNKYFKGISKTGKVRISTANMIQAISEMFTEPILKEGVRRNTGGQVYAILELNGRVKAVNSDAHESYPRAIQSEKGQKTVVHILKDRLDWNDNFIDPETGQAIPKESELRIYPPSVGMSIKGLQLKVREQVSNVRQVVRTAKANGISDEAILKYLADNKLDVREGVEILDRINQEQRRAKQKAEGLFDPSRNVVVNFLDNVYKTSMSGRGYRPLSMQTLSEYKEGSIEAEIRIARKNVKRIENAIKGQKDPKKIISAIDAFMRGEQDHGVPEAMIPMVSDMRRHLDNLSKKLVDSGAIPSTESRQNIINNLGSYLNRSYEIFDNKNYAKKITDQVKQAAKNKLRDIYREYAEIESLRSGVPVDIVLERRVDRAIDEILNQDEGNEFVIKSKLGSKNLKPLEQRKDIPAEIRALMGEYGDPAMNYVRSIQKVASIIASQNYQKQLRKAGEGVYLFTEQNGIYNVKIAGDSSKSMDILAGMYTTKDIAEAMTASGIIDIDLRKAQPIYDYYLKAVGAVKYTKTILSLGTHAKNIIGNVPFMIANGNFSFKAFNEAIDVLKAEYKQNGNQELLNKMDEYTRLGIINQSTTLNEVKELLSSGKTFEDVMIDRSAQKVWGRIVTKGRSFLGVAQKAYQVEDDFFKIAGYELEKVKYAKALFNKKPNQLTETESKEVSDRAAAIVKNTLPNYGRIGGYVKLLKAIPVAGTFISFTSESVRTSYNTIDLTMKEIADPKTRAIGINRLAGIMALAAVKAGIVVLWGMNSGDDEEESLEQARKFLPFWDEYSTIAPTEIKDGVFKYRSISASDPHGYMTKVFNAYYSSDSFREGLINALGEAAEPWTNPDILFSELTEMIFNRDKNGRPIFKEGDTSKEITEKVLSRIWKTYVPGTITSARKIAKSENPGNEAIGQFTGFKEHSVDILDVLGYKSYDIKNRANEASSDYPRAKNQYKRGEITIEQRNEEYDRANEKWKNVYKDAIEYYNGALYFGIDERDVQQKMLDSGVPKYVLRGVILGEIPDMTYD